MTSKRLSRSIVVAAILLFARSEARANEALIARFKAEAPRGWAAIEKVTQRLAGHVVDTQNEQIVGRPRRVFEAVYDTQALGTCVLVHVISEQVNGEPFGERACCASPKIAPSACGEPNPSCFGG